MADIPESTKSGLEIAHDIIATDLADAEEHCDPDWIDQSKTALDAIIKCLATRAAPPAMDREAVAQIIDPTSFCDVPYTDDPIMIDMVKTWQDTALAKADAILSTLSADAIRQGEVFIRMVSRLTHSGDDGWTPDDADDATQTLDGLIAKARTTISGHMVDCAWHVDQYPHECTCALATPASHASDGGKA
ncbi:hypothetical protein [uncultured Novosphingobium sp.]|uniref:hypothetical protein n=1 Tax=uncultured Novosphingobium sp. TaxID=292277 RepID=UPI003749B725